MKKRELTPLGVLIKTRLNEIGMTQYWLAKKVGMNTSYLYLIMTGERSGKTYMNKISRALGIDLKKCSKSA
ncbi:helix-turn-helix domain-containing protein [Paenibacillus lentus]|uniref:helix-turn-helix domain-containing protein n=1 Tax=Paenibacillus lentus TaxID=1338368 RepID=UPI0036516441